MASVAYDNLHPWEQRLIDSAISLSPGAVLALMNNFDIGREYLAELLVALHANDVPKLYQWQANSAPCDRDAFASALDRARKLPSHGVFHTDDGKTFVLDTSGFCPPGTVTVATVTQFVALLEAAYADSVQNIELATEELAQRTSYPNRLNKDRYELWTALLSFWRDILHRKITYTTDAYEDYRPKGAVIDFLMAASAEWLSEDQKTPGAIYSFLKRNKGR